ncbi:MAG: DUF4390 domain-containing protein [Burkholderiales bacterium]|nr:DUF4390 domain-containing protein [Burkholderiales bacterium]
MSLRLLVPLLLVLAFCWSAQTRAEDIAIRHISLEANDDGYILDADFEIDLNPRLEDAINKGVALYFEVEFELTRKRWYWFDEHPVSRQLTLRLSYHALTRQYRISRGALHQSFSSLSDALRVLSRVRSWRVLERGEVGAGTDYEAALRMRLDLTQLPKPFQVSALTNRDWNLASEWQRWPLQVRAPVTEKAPQ